MIDNNNNDNDNWPIMAYHEMAVDLKGTKKK